MLYLEGGIGKKFLLFHLPQTEVSILEVLKYKNTEAHIPIVLRGMTSLYNLWKMCKGMRV